MISYHNAGWFLANSREPVFTIHALPNIPLCFPQSQEMTWEKAMAFIKAIANSENLHVEMDVSWSPMLLDGYQTKAGYYRLTNGSNFDLEIPALGVVATAQSLAKTLEDWMDVSLTELPDVKNELEIHLEAINRKICVLEYQGVSTLRSSLYVNTLNSGVRGIVNMVQFNSNWLPAIQADELFRNMWVSIANVTAGGNRINRVNEPPLVEETDRTLISDYLKINGIWGTPIPETFYQLELGSSNALDVYFDHYHELLDFASALATNQEHFAQILDRIAVDWFIGAEERVPEDIDMNTVTASCLEWLASIPMPLVSKAELDLHGWRMRVQLDWVTFGHIGLVKFEFVERLSEVEQ